MLETAVFLTSKLRLGIGAMYQVSAWQAARAPSLIDNDKHLMCCHEFQYLFIKTSLDINVCSLEAFPQYGLQWIIGVTYVRRLQARRERRETCE